MGASKRMTEAWIGAGVVVVALAASLVGARGNGEGSAAQSGSGAAAAASPRPGEAAGPAIHVAFKLDPRLTQGLYMGERWVSPRTYQHAAQVGESSTLDARADVLDSRGAPLAASPTWKPADPDMITVHPPQGNRVQITVRRAGQSHVMLAYGGTSKDLTVNAVRQNGVWRVDVVQ